MQDEVILDTAVTPAEPPPVSENVSFDERQQAKIGDIVRDATVKARADFAKLQSEFDALRKTLPPPPDDIVLELATTRAERDTLRTAQREATVTEILRSAVGAQQFVDSDLAVQLLRSSIQLIDGLPVVVDSAGNQRLTAALMPMTVTALASELSDAKPFLVRSQVRGGAGSKPSNGTGNITPGPSLGSLFGKGSVNNAEAVNRLALHDPTTFARLRRQAIKEGLI
jgi:hypothetical protein